jgi:restriction system protein
MKFLQRFPEYVSARKGGRDGPPLEDGGEPGLPKPPQEIMEEAHQSMAAVLANELLEKIRACSPWFFQKIVKDLLIKMGYGGTPEDVEKSVVRGADEGIDGIINQDRLGLERVYIQAKRWGDSVGRPEVQKFAGALQGQQAHKGVFITTSAFSKEAQEYAAKIPTKIVLVDGELLAQLMIEHGVGTATVKTYEIKQIDSDYFVED